MNLKILDNQQFQRTTPYIFWIILINIMVVPFVLWKFIGLNYGINYLITVGIGIPYILLTWLSVSLYSKTEKYKQKLQNAKERLEKAKILDSKGNKEILEIEQDRLAKTQHRNKQIIGLKQFANLGSLTLRGFALLAGLVLFLFHFTPEQFRDKTEQSELLKTKLSQQEISINQLNQELSELQESTNKIIRLQTRAIEDLKTRINGSKGPKQY